MWALGFWTGLQDRKEAFESKHILLSFLWGFFFFVPVLVTGTLQTAARRILPQMPFAWKTTISVTSTPLSLNVNFLSFPFFFSLFLDKGPEPKKSDGVMVIYRDTKCV